MSTKQREAIIVVSTPRSGSTWLANLLQAHSQLNVHKDNTSILYFLYPLNTFNPFADDFITRNGRSLAIVDRLGAKLVSKYYFSNDNRKLVLVSPTNVAFLPLLTDTFPNAKYIHLRRNPLDAISSFSNFLESRGSIKQRYVTMKKWGVFYLSRSLIAHFYHSARWLSFPHTGYLGVRPSGFQEASHLPLIDFLCWYYDRIESGIAEAMVDISADRCFELNYDRLVLDYWNEMRMLLNFLEVEGINEHLEKTITWISSKGVGRHKKTLNLEQINSVKQFLEIRGYDYA